MAVRTLHVLILDPRKSHRSRLIKELAAFPAVKIVAEVASLAEMHEALATQSPNAIFADPAVQSKNGLAWIDEVPRFTAVILVALQRRHALEAFERRVLDYLLKPVKPSRLRATMLRLFKWLAQQKVYLRVKPVEDKVLLQAGRESSFIRSQSITCIKAEGNYTRVSFRDGTRKMVHRPLRQWKQLLPVNTFLQVHRSLLVNLEQISKLERHKQMGYLLYLNGSYESFSVSRRLAPQLKNYIKTVKREHDKIQQRGLLF